MRTILLAEDDDSMRHFLARALERAGYDVVSYGNGADAFEGLKAKAVTLLLTDIVMPEMDGIELAKRACELHPGMKIMFITGFAAVALQEYSAAPRQSRVLSKPIHLKDLVREVDRMLAA
ncbi:MAG: cell cycle two-component system response regulator CpdR [Rhodomicrobium sp.]